MRGSVINAGLGLSDGGTGPRGIPAGRFKQPRGQPAASRLRDQEEDCATSSTETNYRAPACAIAPAVSVKRCVTALDSRFRRNRQFGGQRPIPGGRRQAMYLCRGCVLRISVILCGDSDGISQISQ